MNLYLFTATYPYDKRETFIESEIQFLSESFDNIYIIPLGGSKTKKRSIPLNCVVYEPIISNKYKQYLTSLFISRKALSLYANDFIKNKVYKSKSKLKTWFISFIHTTLYLNSNVIKNILSEVDESDIFYFYWGKSANTLAPFFINNVKMVSRFHGEWDLWEENFDNYAPIRQKILSSLDIVFPISDKAKSYLEVKYKCGEIIVSRLGTLFHGFSSKSNDNVLRIISCSSVDSNKRVQLILDVLSSISDIKLEWTHIGEGEGFKNLKSNIKMINNNNLKINLLGRLSNIDVFNYYINNPIDVFINLSKNEGIPVSIMEAISCNIPIIATNVGSTSEIVNEDTGILLTANPSIHEVSDAIHIISDKNIKPYDFWNKYYNAEINYSTFIKYIKS